ncbi:MAG: prephenate dehydratase, partial [Pseudomonadota bacterium]
MNETKKRADETPPAGGAIAFQGEPGAFSHLACAEYFPEMTAAPQPSFEDALTAVKTRRAALAMIPIENSLAGRVADIHHLLPESGLFIVGERFLPVHHQLLIRPGAAADSLATVHSHAMALGQCRNVIRRRKLRAIVEPDTAGAAKRLAAEGGPSEAAIASKLAAEIYGLEILETDVEDAGHNTTRFLVMAADPDDMEPGGGPAITSLVFRVRNIPAALYKAMGGFATNGVNMTKLESYQLGGAFHA